ncbi:MAG TPA: ribosome-binding factor A [Candidatus Peribacteraceae bacterium]|nr:ribosome-binding factor A [Candidatus Peribacteraceae bacterium]
MSKRPKMLASVIREIVAPVLRECPRECGMVSLTEVEVSNDFSHATLYVSALKEPDLALRFLEGRLLGLQRSLGRLHRKRIPLLRFRKDQRTERGIRIEELLQ